MSETVIRKERIDPRRIPSAADKWVFAALFFGGAGGLIWLKIHNYSPFHVTLFPLVAMALYALIALATERFRLRADQIGDNCYYLGFLFTLTSLAISLVQFHTEALAAEEIIVNFGVALATTIFGLLGRVFFVQFRQTPIEVEREAQLSLASASSRLRSELDALTRDFNAYTRGLKQSISEAITGTAETTNKSLTEATEQFRKIAEEVVSRVDEIFKVHVDNAAQLNKLSKKTVTAFEAVVSRIEKIEAPSDLISTKLSPLVREVEQVVQAMSAREQETHSKIRDFDTALQESVQCVTALNRHLAELSGRSTEMEELSGQFRQFMGALEKGFDPVVDSISRHRVAIDGAQAAAEASFKRSAEAFQEALAAQGKAAETLASGIERRAEALVAPLSAVSAEGVKEINGLEKALAELVTKLQTHNREIERELERSRGATVRVQQSLTEMIDTVTETLANGSEKSPEEMRV